MSCSDPTIATILNKTFVNVFNRRKLVLPGGQHFLNWTSLSQNLSLYCQIWRAGSFSQHVNLLSAWTLRTTLSSKSANYYKLWEIQQKSKCSSCSIQQLHHSQIRIQYSDSVLAVFKSLISIYQTPIQPFHSPNQKCNSSSLSNGKFREMLRF